MMVSNRKLLFQGFIFRCHVSFREGNVVFLPEGSLSDGGSHRPCTGDLFVGLRNNPQLSAALAAGDEANLMKLKENKCGLFKGYPVTLVVIEFNGYQ